jgi:two-component system sensor histidine kinase PilS (NtrC family)
MPTPPENNQNPHESIVEHLLVNQLLWMLFLRVVLYTLLLGVSLYLQGKQFNVVTLPPHLLLFFIILVYLSSIISGLVLLKTEVDPKLFGIKQNLLDTLFVTILVCLTGGSQSIFAPIYFFPIIAGGLITPRLGGIIAASAATMQYGFLLSLEYYRIFPNIPGISLYTIKLDALATLNMFAVYGLTFFLAAILSSLFAGRLRKTEDALSDSVRDFGRLSLLYKQIFDDISTGIITTDDNNKISSANNAAHLITGYSTQDLISQDFYKFFPNVTFHKTGTRHSVELKRKDGEIIQIGYSFARLQHNEQNVSSQTSSRDTQTCQNCKVVTIQDISEIERLQKQMQQAEKLATVGRMSAGIAHDFRNPLTAISGSAQVLANELTQLNLPNQQTNFDLINIILRESNRLSNTVSDFLKFARPEHAEKDWLSLERCLNEVIEVAQASPIWPENWTIERQIDDVVDIWADQYQLFTILNHLLQNAQAFCPLGNERIRVKAKEVKESEGDERIEICVEDNGPGISPGREKKIFEPFYTKRVDGTGLGLAIVKQMMLEHQGDIRVEKSSLGGAKFILSFPLPVEEE